MHDHSETAQLPTVATRAQGAVATRDQGVFRVFELLTIAVVLGIAAFGLVGLAAAMLGHARPAVVLPLGVLVWLGLLWMWRPDRFVPAGRPVRSWVVIAGLVIIAAATLVNLIYHGQYVLTNRDPGIYSNGGAWIAQHGSLVVHSRDGVLDGVKGVQANALGQQSLAGNDNRLEIQGAHLFPVLLAFGYWVAGPHGLFAVPALIGAASLAVLLLVCLRFLPDWVAVTVVTAVAVNFAWIYTIRSVLSEPLMLTFAFGGLIFTVYALIDRSVLRLIVAGLIVAVSLVIRSDAGVAVLLLLPAVAFVIGRAYRQSGGGGRNPWVLLGCYLLGWLVPAVMGWIDLMKFSPFYVFFHKTEIALLEAGLIASLILAAATLAISVSSVSGTHSWISRSTALWSRNVRWVAIAAPLAIVGIAIIAWWLRPLLGQHLTILGGPGKASMEAIQKRDGLSLNGDRTYDEISVPELIWYIGPLVFIGSVLGVALYVRRFIAGRLPNDITILLALVAPISVLYLYRPSLYPDQPWAIRRFLPITIPGFLILAALFAVWLFQRFGDSEFLTNKVFRRGTAVALVAAALLPPLLVTWPLRSARWEAGGIAGIESLCDSIGPKGVALLSYEIGPVMLPAVRGFCDPDTPAALVAKPTAAGAIDSSAIAGVAHQAGRSLTVIAQSRKALLQLAPNAVDVHPVTILDTTEVVSTLERPPAQVAPLGLTLWVGQVPATG